MEFLKIEKVPCKAGRGKTRFRIQPLVPLEYFDFPNFKKYQQNK